MSKKHSGRNPLFCGLICLLTLAGCGRSGSPAPVVWGYQKAATSSRATKSVSQSSVSVKPAINRGVQHKPVVTKSRLANDDIQILEIQDGREKRLSSKQQKETSDDLKIIEIQEGKERLLETPSETERKVSNSDSENSFSENQDIPGLPVPTLKPNRMVEEQEPEATAEDVNTRFLIPVPLCKPNSVSARPSVMAPSMPPRSMQKRVSKVPSHSESPVVSHKKLSVAPAAKEEEDLFFEETISDEERLASPKSSFAPEVEDTSTRTRSSSLFSWPLKGKILKGFSKSGQSGRNDGLNIEGALGDPVRAARQGQVVYVGNELHGFGHLVLIKHDDEWMSAYAHLGTVHVQRGDTVNRGQVIAKVGSSGSVSHPQIHFEVRHHSQPVDPRRFLE